MDLVCDCFLLDQIRLGLRAEWRGLLGLTDYSVIERSFGKYHSGSRTHERTLPQNPMLTSDFLFLVKDSCFR